MFRYRLRILVLSMGVLFGYTSAYRHIVHGHGHGHGWRDGDHECWHWPGSTDSAKPGTMSPPPAGHRPP